MTRITHHPVTSLNGEMAFRLENSSDTEQRAVIRFLTAEGVEPVDIHRRMVAVYGEDIV